MINNTTLHRLVILLQRQAQISAAHLTFLILLTFSCFAPTTFGHKPSDSYLRIQGYGKQLTAEWDIALKDLEFLIGLDDNQNGEITWGELRSQQSAIAAHALSRCSLTVNGKPCELQLEELLVTDHSDGAYAVLRLSSDHHGSVETMGLHYDLLFDADPTHRGLVLLDNGKVTSTHVLSPSNPELSITAGDYSPWYTLKQYVTEGVWHIWIGYDHILFLLALLLPAVYLLQDQEWHPVSAFRPACRSVLKIVTVFTIAHSITLWLAVMEYVTLPSRWVEATIALSIIITAFNNLYPVLRLPAWVIAFGFGLIHGFGFANVLNDLGLSNMSLAVSLFGFNVGVELGQIAIVLAFLPIAYLLRQTAFYKRGIFQAGSVLVALIGAIWVYERLGDVEILGF